MSFTLSLPVCTCVAVEQRNCRLEKIRQEFTQKLESGLLCTGSSFANGDSACQLCVRINSKLSCKITDKPDVLYYKKFSDIEDCWCICAVRLLRKIGIRFYSKQFSRKATPTNDHHHFCNACSVCMLICQNFKILSSITSLCFTVLFY